LAWIVQNEYINKENNAGRKDKNKQKKRSYLLIIPSTN